MFLLSIFSYTLRSGPWGGKDAASAANPAAQKAGAYFGIIPSFFMLVNTKKFPGSYPGEPWVYAYAVRDQPLEA